MEEEPEGGRRSRREQQQGEGSEEEGGQGQEGGEEGSSTEGDEEDEEVRRHDVPASMPSASTGTSTRVPPCCFFPLLPQAQELRDLDLRVAADVAAMAATAMRPMTKHDKMLIKCAHRTPRPLSLWRTPKLAPAAESAVQSTSL